MNDTEQLHDMLHQVATHAAPAPRIDIERARSRGRTVRRARRAAIGGAAALLLAAGVGVTTLAPPHSAPPKLQIDSSTGKYPDPLLETAKFGWLPTGYTVGWTYDKDSDGAFGLDAGPKGGGINGGPDISLQDFGKGPEPALGSLPGGAAAKRITAEPVNGHHAYWIYTPSPTGQSNFELRWEYAPEHWADLQAVNVPGSAQALTALAYKVAGSVKFDQRIQGGLPLQITDLPAGLGTPRVTLGTKPGLETDLTFGDGTLSIGMSSARPVNTAKYKGATKLEINGHTAYEFANQNGADLYVFVVNGYDLSFNAGPHHPDLVKLAQHTTVFGADQSQWTTDPLG